jgi:hypothetical protein
MIKNFICWLWGHNQVNSNWYEKWVSANHYVTGNTYDRLPFCKRCGKLDGGEPALSPAKQSAIKAALDRLGDEEKLEEMSDAD